MRERPSQRGNRRKRRIGHGGEHTPIGANLVSNAYPAQRGNRDKYADSQPTERRLVRLTNISCSFHLLGLARSWHGTGGQPFIVGYMDTPPPCSGFSQSRNQPSYLDPVDHLRYIHRSTITSTIVQLPDTYSETGRRSRHPGGSQDPVVPARPLSRMFRLPVTQDIFEQCVGAQQS